MFPKDQTMLIDNTYVATYGMQNNYLLRAEISTYVGKIKNRKRDDNK